MPDQVALGLMEEPQVEPQEEMQEKEQEVGTAEPACGNCEYFDPKNDEVGVCHKISGSKEPPLVSARGMLLVPPDFSCALFEPIAEEEEEAPVSQEELMQLLGSMR